ncbi:hypothetical protein EYV94_12000 [Puteibacter caeruleilacunae]|nr:hypothetical protein EYV94_12000 [Puteibacter caeruleilacunae]
MANIVVNDFIPIPDIFYPEGKTTPFKHCKVCDRELIESEETYFIEKHYRQDIKTGKRMLDYELVICWDCAMKFRQQLSKKSQATLQKYFIEKVDMKARTETLKKHKLFEVNIWLQHCIVTQKNIEELDDFKVSAICAGPHMLFHDLPYMISGEVVDELSELLSKETQEIMDDFFTEHVDLPPEMEDIFNPKKRVFV